MQRRRLVSQRLVAIFLLGCLLFNYPLLAVFNRLEALFGIPAVFLWLMASWLALIACIAWVVERSTPMSD